MQLSHRSYQTSLTLFRDPVLSRGAHFYHFYFSLEVKMMCMDVSVSICCKRGQVCQSLSLACVTESTTWYIYVGWWEQTGTQVRIITYYFTVQPTSSLFRITIIHNHCCLIPLSDATGYHTCKASMRQSNHCETRFVTCQVQPWLSPKPHVSCVWLNNVWVGCRHNAVEVQTHQKFPLTNR